MLHENLFLIKYKRVAEKMEYTLCKALKSLF